MQVLLQEPGRGEQESEDDNLEDDLLPVAEQSKKVIPTALLPANKRI